MCLAIADQIEHAIFAGVFHPGDLLPTQRDIADDLGFHFNTINAAFREAARRGLIVSRPRRARIEGLAGVTEENGKMSDTNTSDGQKGLFIASNWLAAELARAGKPPVWINPHGSKGTVVDTLLFGGVDAISVEEDGTVTHWSQAGQPSMPHRAVSKWYVSSSSDAMQLASTLALYIDHRPMPTQGQVLDAFDSIGCAAVQHIALQKRLRQQGFDSAMVALALTKTIALGALVMDGHGSLRRP
ncbi:GntR family transcriptional regulator [Paraburkholderia youngii]|uniref:GntR family transcriptional regulator n=1 Tax=Paraburkholderia youngii TaxID=2782701 RepID=UPI003D1CFA7B